MTSVVVFDLASFAVGHITKRPNFLKANEQKNAFELSRWVRPRKQINKMTLRLRLATLEDELRNRVATLKAHQNLHGNAWNLPSRRGCGTCLELHYQTKLALANLEKELAQRGIARLKVSDELTRLITEAVTALKQSTLRIKTSNKKNRQAIQDLDQRLAEQEAQIKANEAQIKAKEAELQAKQAQINELQAQLQGQAESLVK